MGLTREQKSEEITRLLESNDVQILNEDHSDEMITLLGSEHAIRAHALLLASSEPTVARNLAVMLGKMFADLATKIQADLK
jgi:hypothetical protein